MTFVKTELIEINGIKKYNIFIVHTLFGIKITFTLPDVVLSGRRTVRVVPQGREVSPILMETVLR